MEGGEANMRFTLVAAPLLVCLYSCAPEGAPLPRSGELANRAAALIEAGDADGLASLFHYPPTYSKQELDADAAGVAAGLRFLLERFGVPRSIKAVSEVACYPVGVFGGTNEYWRSISPWESRQFDFAAKFPEFGPGYLVIEVFQHDTSDAPEIRSLAFCIPESESNARSYALDTMEDLAAAMGISLPPGSRVFIEEDMEREEGAGNPLP